MAQYVIMFTVSTYDPVGRKLLEKELDRYAEEHNLNNPKRYIRAPTINKDITGTPMPENLEEFAFWKRYNQWSGGLKWGDEDETDTI